MADSFYAAWRANTLRLARRWDPRGLLVNDEQAKDALAKLKSPRDHGATALARAQWTVDAAVHPVLEQAVPSAFRVCSFLPVTSVLSLAMISSKSPTAALLYHWLYQSHSAATRYCNYADTSRPLDGNRMMTAYAASTAAAWGVSVGVMALVSRIPRMNAIGLIVPHTAVACAGAVSTVMNAERELEDGVPVLDAAGNEVGVSREAAKATIAKAVLLHSVVVPSCALLLPVVAMRAYVVPRLLRSAPNALWPVAAGLVVGCSCVITPVVAATISPEVTIDPQQLEPELAEKILRGTAGDGAPVHLRSSRELY